MTTPTTDPIELLPEQPFNDVLIMEYPEYAVAERLQPTELPTELPTTTVVVATGLPPLPPGQQLPETGISSGLAVMALLVLSAGLALVKVARS
jgi:hypothetical protein